jgi:two-component system, LytTR family, sensor kinase
LYFQVLKKVTKLNRYLKQYAIIFAVSFVAYLVRIASGQFSAEFNLILFITSLVLISTGWASLEFVNRKLNTIFPYERSIPGRIAIQLASGAVIGVFIRFIIYQFGEPLLPFRLDSLFLAATWALYILATATINAIFFISYFIDKWKESLITAERLEKEKSQMQFDNLKNQLNPHFLFNALTSLNGLIFEDQKLASDFLQQLSKVYRYVLQHSNGNFVSLKTELVFIRNYIQLVETRFQGALTINLQINPSVEDQAIVPVTLQVLIENAIKHNVIDKNRPLTIDLVTVGDYLVVSNNLQIRKTVEYSNKQGLERLQSLYQFLTTKPVIIEPSIDRFSVKVPLI